MLDYSSGSAMTLTSPEAPANGATDTELPRTVAELWERWRELPPVLTPDQVLEAGWLGVTRAPLYRAIARGDLPSVRLGRRVFLLTAPLMHLLGVDLDQP